MSDDLDREWAACNDTIEGHLDQIGANLTIVRNEMLNRASPLLQPILRWLVCWFDEHPRTVAALERVPDVVGWLRRWWSK